jgi:DNA invertase Pin-like site-specific DNA recombinase/phage FluMu protein Com
LEYALYLRKSRADAEAEARGEGETLARHRAALLALADKAGYHIKHIYQEIVSGDTIAARPEMQALLSAVQRGEYAGVICNDIDRLSRGDMGDQSIIQTTFAATGTLIITPGKVYDPSNDSDSMFVDMSLFLARLEYKQIKKRMYMGRVRAAAEGHVQSGRVPFGYIKVKDGKGGNTYEIDPERAEVVRLIFGWYTGESGPAVGQQIIANRLNDMQVTTRTGVPWAGNTVDSLLCNPAYIGRYIWQAYKTVTVYEGGQKKKRRQKNPNPIVIEDAFPPIINRETWERVREIYRRRATPKVNAGDELKNPLAGLVRCAVCGRTLIRISGHGHDILMCPRRRECPTKSIPMYRAEEAILEGLQGWTVKYTTPPPKEAKTPPELSVIVQQKEKLEAQLKRAFELVETGVYTPQIFVERRDALQAKIATLDRRAEELKTAPTVEDGIIKCLPFVRHVIDAYELAETVKEKNELLKSIVDHIDYARIGETAPEFTIYPRILPE